MSIVTEKDQTDTTEVETKKRDSSTRQPLSAFAQIALWPSVLRVVITIGGAIGLAVTGYSQNIDIFTIGVFSLAIVILLAARVRWAGILAIPMAIALLYITATQPYVLASLGNPYGSAGGFIKFIVVVVALACSLLVLGGTIGDAVLKLHRSHAKAPAWLPAAVTLVIGMMLGGLYVGAFSQAATPTGLSYTNGVPTVYMSQIGFSQTTVTIPKGSSLLLINPTSVVHNLFNGTWQNDEPHQQQEVGAPVVNGAQIAGGSRITIGPFSTAGTYHFFCTIHQGMSLTVIVQ